MSIRRIHLTERDWSEIPFFISKQVPQYDFFQHDTADGVRLAQGTVFSIGGANVILLFQLEVVSPAKIHLAAAIGAVHQPGEHTHVPHLGRAAASLPDILNNQEHAFLNDRLLGILEDHPFRRVIPNGLFALERWFAGLEIDRMA